MNKILISFLIISNIINAKILLFTYAYNRPDFIEVQYKTFKKFLHDEYEFVVFSDANNVGMANQIQQMCAKYDIKHIPVPQSIHNKPYLKRWAGENYNAPAVRNSNVVMYSLNEYGFNHDDIIALLDSDMFLIKDFSIRDYMQNYDLSGIEQPRPNGIKYLWIGLTFLDMRSMPNKNTIDFNCGKIGKEPVDAGGQTHNYIINNPQAKIRWMEEDFMKGFHFVDEQTKAVNIPDNTVFLHYYAGTNWTNYPASYHQHKTVMFNNYIASILEN